MRSCPAWAFFNRQYEVGELLVVASGLLLIAVLLPAVLFKFGDTTRKARRATAPDSGNGLRAISRSGELS